MLQAWSLEFSKGLAKVNLLNNGERLSHWIFENVVRFICLFPPARVR